MTKQWYPEPRKSKLYGNSVVRNKDGEVIFRTSSKRCKWYIERGLATYHIIASGGYDVTLNFETNGPGNRGDEFYLQQRENVCVVCGTDKDLCRYHIVPVGLRKHFPDGIKNHSYHDVVLVCTVCHFPAIDCREELLKQLIQVLDVSPKPLWNKDAHVERIRAKSAAWAILKHKDKIPSDRLERLKEDIQNVYPGIDITKPSNLKTVADIPIPKPAVKTPEQMLVKRFNGNIETITKLVVWPFRNNFIAAMRPRCMPKYWTPERVAK